MLRKETQKTRLDHLYWVNRKGYKRAAEELKQWIKVKAATLKRYKNRVKQYQQNRLFQSNQTKFYQELDGKSHEEDIIPDKEKDWIQKVAEELQSNKEQNIEIIPTKIKERIHKMAN